MNIIKYECEYLKNFVDGYYCCSWILFNVKVVIIVVDNGGSWVSDDKVVKKFLKLKKIVN